MMKIPTLLLSSLFFYLFACLAAADNLPARTDIRLLVDVSGSMKANDPANLRRPAVDLLVRLLPADSRAGIWLFAEGVQPLVGHAQVDEQWRQAALARAQSVHSRGLFTNIGAALEQAAFDAATASTGYQRHIILLTDGMVDIDKDPQVNASERRRVIEQVLPRLQLAGLKVHTIALSNEADAQLMQTLALETDATSAVVHNADELMRAFLNTFDAVAPAQQLPLDDQGFTVDARVEEFTALIFRSNPQGQTRLLAPTGNSFGADSTSAQLRWHRAADYDLITVSQPAPGLWQLQGKPAPGSRVTVVSDLNLRVKPLPNNLLHGDTVELSFRFEDGESPLNNADFLKLLDIRLSLEAIDGPQPDSEVYSHRFAFAEASPEGHYRHALTQFARLGAYVVRLSVDGKTFQRSFSHRLTVRQPFLAAIEEHWSADGTRVLTLRVSSKAADIPPQSTRIVATVIGPDRRRIVRPLHYDVADQAWLASLPPTAGGDHQVLVRVSGEDRQGDSFDFTLEPLVLPAEPLAPFQPAPADEEPLQSLQGAEVDAPAETTAESDVSPWRWAIYTVLGLLNVVLLAGAVWFIRRQLRARAGVAAEVDEVEPSAIPDDEQEPPMEDLDDPADPPDEAELQAASPWASSAATPVVEDDFGLDDLEDELQAQLAGEDAADAGAANPAPEQEAGEAVDPEDAQGNPSGFSMADDMDEADFDFDLNPDAADASPDDDPQNRGL